MLIKIGDGGTVQVRLGVCNPHPVRQLRFGADGDVVLGRVM